MESELFYQEFAVRFLIFFKEMTNFCEQYVQKQPSSQYSKPMKPSGRNFKQFSQNNQFSHSRRRKEPIDPDAPKKPLSSFILFYKEKMQEYQSKNPSLSMTEITKLIGKVWNNLSEQDQNEYKQKSLNLKQAYEKDYAAYAQRKGIVIPQKKGQRKNNQGKVELLIDEDDEEEKDEDIEIIQNNSNTNNNKNSNYSKNIIDVDEDEDEEISSESDDDDDDIDEEELNKMAGGGGNTSGNHKKPLLSPNESDEEFSIKKKIKQ